MWTGNVNTVECPLCSYFSPNLTLHVSHLRLVHAKDPSFNITCSIGGCREVFTAFAAYNSHVYRHHRVALGLETCPDSGNVISTAGPSANEVDIPSFVDASLDDDEPASVHNELAPTHMVPLSGPSLQTTRAAKFLLHLREGRRVSQVALTDVMGTCNMMCMQAVNDLKQEVREKCAQANVDIGSIAGLEDVLSKQPPHPFEGVNTTYRFEQFCVQHFSCLVSFVSCLEYKGI